MEEEKGNLEQVEDLRQQLARERMRRSLMANRAATGYRFRDPKAIAAKYSKPSEASVAYARERAPQGGRPAMFAPKKAPL